MRIGFTGTQDGMTSAQHKALKVTFAVLGTYDPIELHHGDCVGADDQAVNAVRYLGCGTLVCHPPENEAKRARNVRPGEDVRPAKPYLERNHDIVDDTTILFASPKGPEAVRSGTWATVRYARKMGKPVRIFWPDGTVTAE